MPKHNVRVLKIAYEEVRRGWVRIPMKLRAKLGLDLEDLIEIEYGNNKPVLRIVLGHEDEDYSDDDIFMDEPTRLALDLESGKNYILDYYYIGRWNVYKKCKFYWYHPDFPLRFSTRLAIILGNLSLIVSLLGLIASVYSIWDSLNISCW